MIPAKPDFRLQASGYRLQVVPMPRSSSRSRSVEVVLRTFLDANLPPAHDGGPPGGWITPSCNIVGRSSRVAQCSASLPPATRYQWLWRAAKALPVGGTTPFNGPRLVPSER